MPQVDQDTKVRAPDYAARLTLAFERNPNAPGMNGRSGRLPWIVARLAEKGHTATPQSANRWFRGEVKPRLDKSNALAEILSVDPVWLYNGVDPDLTDRERRARNAMADGVVNLVAGMIAMDGATVAFPAEGDRRALLDHIHIYATIKGVHYGLHISAGERAPEGVRFIVPDSHEGLVMIGVVRDGFNFQLVEITPEMIEQHGSAGRGRTRVVQIGDEQIAGAALKDFTQRL